MRSGLGFLRLSAVAAVSVFVSGCAVPPIVTAVSVGADIFSLAETGKTVADNGISFVMQQDCRLLRAFGGSVCQDYAPGEDTPEGALVALAPVADPTLDPSAADPMAVPRNLAYLDGALGLAVASGPAPQRGLPAVAFARVDDNLWTGVDLAGPDALTYLAAGIGG